MSEKGDTEESKKPPSWSHLIQEYTQETTLHGLRFVTMETVILRRIIWCITLLGALALFIYLVVSKVFYLQSHPKAVNVEVTYNESLIFPAVTICNANKYKLTSVQEEGLYDLLVVEYEHHLKELPDAACDKYFSVHKGVCGLTRILDYTESSSATLDTPWRMSVQETTRQVCRHLCSELYDMACSSVLYHARDRSCMLSSFSGSIEGRPCSNEVDFKNFELHRRQRCDVPMDFDCKFDITENCPLKDGDGNDTWIRVTGEDVQTPATDNSNDQADYGFLYLLESDNRALYDAVKYTDYYNTTGKCLSLAYSFLGSGIGTWLTVRAYREDKSFVRLIDIKRTASHSTTEAGNWFIATTKLPHGLHQLVITGRRSKFGPSGLALDDIKVTDCMHSKENCYNTWFGREYMGNEMQSEDLEPCLSWKRLSSSIESLLDVSYFSERFFPDDSMEAAGSFCRSIPLLSESPGCFTNANIWQRDSYRKCDITFCECSQSQFQCKNRFCISTELLCDGKNDCGDNSDETDPCVRFATVSCDFASKFVCGYTSHPFNAYQWIRSKIETASNIPEIEGNGIKHVMLLQSSVADGDKASLSTPFLEVTNPTELSFYTYIQEEDEENKSPNSTIKPAYLDVFLTLGGIKRVFLSNITIRKEWKREVISLPSGTYKITFEGTQGKGSYSDIALAKVRVEENKGTLQPTDSFLNMNQSSFNCSFNDNDCGYTVVKDSIFLECRSIPFSLINDDSIPVDLYDYESCQELFTDTKGTLTSPNFPKNYPRIYKCTYYIAGGNHLTKIEFGDVDTEHYNACVFHFIKVIIYLNDGTIEKPRPLCGTISATDNPISGTYDAKLISIRFESGTSGTGRGFNLTYEALNATIDYSKTCRYAAPKSTIDHSVFLVSPIIHGSSTRNSVDHSIDDDGNRIKEVEGCLSIEFLSSTNSSIVLKYESSQDTLIRAPLGLGNKTHRVMLPVIIRSDQMSVIVIGASTSAAQNYYYLISINNIEYMNSSCLNSTQYREIAEKSIACDFEDINLCGYFFSLTRNPDVWLRIHMESFDSMIKTMPVSSNDDLGGGDEDRGYSGGKTSPSSKYAMGLTIDQEKGGTLFAPQMEVNEASCLSFWTKLFIGPDTSKLRELPSYEFGKLYVGWHPFHVGKFYAANISLANRWVLHTVTVEPGRDLYFDFKTTISQSVIQWLETHIILLLTEINITEQACSITTEEPVTQAEEEVNATFSASTVSADVVLDTTAIGTTIFESTTDIPESNEADFLPQPNTLGPSVNYYNYLVSLTEGTPIYVINKKLGHRMNDTVVSCAWNGFEGTCDILDEEPTDGGYCFTFNGDIDFPFRTKRTGSKFGLQLVMNVERYEYSTVFNQIDAGIKVHLHPQGDAISVKELGFGVSTGVHTLAGITYSETTSLEPPWGTCSSIPIMGRDTYTRVSCQMECLRNATVNECNCQSDYMIGEHRECLLNDTLDCVETHEGAIFVEREACELLCPDACSVVTQPASLSSNLMLGANLFGTFNEDYKSVIRRQFKNAEYIRGRVEPDLFEDTIQTLLDVSDSFTRVNNFIRSKISNELTSTIHQIAKSINKFYDLSDTDVQQIFSHYASYSAFYHNTTEDTVAIIHQYCNEIIQNLALLNRDLSEYIFTASWYFGLDDTLETLLNNTLAAIQAFTSAYKVSENEHEHGGEEYHESVLSLEQLTRNDELSESCAYSIWTSWNAGGYYDELKTFLEDLRDSIKQENGGISSTGAQSKGSEVKSYLKENLDGIKTYFRKTILCTSEYGDFLEDLSTFLDTTSKRSYVVADSFGREFTDMYSGVTEFLTSSLKQYTKGEMTKEDLALSIVQMDIDALRVNLSTSFSSYNSDVSSMLKLDIADAHDYLVNKYSEAINLAQEFTEYFTSDTKPNPFLQSARSASIWRHPYPVIESPQIISFKLSPSMVWSVWPESQSISTFISLEGISKATSFISDYLDTLSDDLYQLDYQLEQEIDVLEKSLEQLGQHFDNYLNELTVDANFVSENFMRLDIYFGELKYESMTQKRDYDIGTLFSEIGGYMGLLLGGSVITVVEVLDLFIFNSLRKSFKRNKATVDVITVMGAASDDGHIKR